MELLHPTGYLAWRGHRCSCCPVLPGESRFSRCWQGLPERQHLYSTRSQSTGWDGRVVEIGCAYISWNRNRIRGWNVAAQNLIQTDGCIYLLTKQIRSHR